MADAKIDEETQIKDIIRRAIKEDSGGIGDVTTAATVPSSTKASASFLAKASGVLSGLKVAEMVFAEVHNSFTFQWTKKDGDHVTKGEYFGSVEGPAPSLVIAERIALNIMQRMSGIATQTRKMVDEVGSNPAKILDTRKTAPNLRVLDKMAVRHGGGMNHRFGLYDMVMIKDNHVTAAGGVSNAVNRVHEYFKEKSIQAVPIEVETRTLDEVKEVLKFADKVDRVMLDNMVKVDPGSGSVDVTMLASAVELIDGKIPTEASGNVTLDTVAAIAATGVSFISSGALTHSVTALDISLKIKKLQENAF